MKELLSKGILLLAAHILVSLSNILAIPLIIKAGNAEMLGAFSIYSILLSVVFGISGFGVGFKFRRLLPSISDNNTRSELFNPQFTFQLCSIIIICLILFSFWMQLSSFFGIHEKILIVNPILFFFYLISQFLFSQFSDYFRYTHKILVYSIASSLNPLLYFLIIFIYYYSKINFNVNIFIFSQSLATFIISIFLFIKINSEIKIRIKFLNLEQLKYDILIGFPLILSFLTDVFLSSSDRFVIASFMSVKYVGYYLPSYSLGMLIILFPRLLGVLLPPIFSREYDKGNKKVVEKLFIQFTAGFLLISCAYVSGAFVLAKPILDIYTNPLISQHSWINVPIVSCGAVFYGLILIYSNILTLEMKTKDLFQATILSASINLFLNIIILMYYKSILVPAITTLISYFISFIIVRNKIKSNWDVNFSSNFFLKLFSITLTTGLATKIMYEILLHFGLNSLFVIINSIIIGVTAFVAMLFLLKFLSFNIIKKFTSQYIIIRPKV